MPKLERWEEKVIGRVKRFENTRIETFQTRFYSGLKAVANYGIGKLFQSARRRVGAFLGPVKPHTINGKIFREKVSTAQKIGRTVGIAVADTAIEKTGNAVESFLNRDFFYPTGEAVASATFGGHVTFDKELIRQMSNACGYAPDMQNVLKELHDTAYEVDQGLTDITWRKEVIPHMLRSAYQTELEKSFQAIRKKHRENPDFYNRQLMAKHMTVAAQRLGDIFEKFSLDLANKTEYLEAPMSFLPKPAVDYSNIEMTDTEKDLLTSVTRHSIFDNEKTLQKQISKAIKKQPKPTTQAAMDQFMRNLEKPARTTEGQETPYVRGVNPDEDTRRLDNSILNLREMKQRYENRNFFSRYLTRAGRAERAAIEQMRTKLQETMGLQPAELDTLLDLKNPLERGTDLVKFMGIEQKEPEIEPVSLTDTATELIKNAFEKTSEIATEMANTGGEILLDLGSKTYSAANRAVSGIQSTVNNAFENVVNSTGLSSDFMGDVNLFEGLSDDDIWGDLSTHFPDDSQRIKPEPPKNTNEPAKPEELVKPSEQTEVKAQTESTEVKEQPVLNEQPVLEKTEETQVQEQPAETSTQEVQENTEESKTQENSPAPIEPKTESSPGFLGTIWNATTTVASYANPLNIIRSIWSTESTKPVEPIHKEAPVETKEIPETKEITETTEPTTVAEEEITQPNPTKVETIEQTVPVETTEVFPAKPEEQPKQTESSTIAKEPSTPLQKIQAKQTEVVQQLVAAGNDYFKIYFSSVAKLMYYKTLEVSLNNEMLDVSKLEESLTNECVDKNSETIMRQPAFKGMSICTYVGLAANSKAFVAKAAKDPSEISRVHKEYMIYLKDPSAIPDPKKLKEQAKAAKNKESAAKVVNTPNI